MSYRAIIDPLELTILYMLVERKVYKDADIRYAQGGQFDDQKRSSCETR